MMPQPFFIFDQISTSKAMNNPSLQRTLLSLFLASTLLFGIIMHAEAQQNTELYKVAMKQKHKLTLISIKNNSSEDGVFGVKLNAINDNIKFVKARSWDRERIDQNTVVLSTNDRPLTVGRSLIILLITGDTNPSLEWTLLDERSEIISEGNIDNQNQLGNGSTSSETEKTTKDVYIELSKYSAMPGERIFVKGKGPTMGFYSVTLYGPEGPYVPSSRDPSMLQQTNRGYVPNNIYSDDGEFDDFFLVRPGDPIADMPGQGFAWAYVRDDRNHLLLNETIPFEIKPLPTEPLAVFTDLEEYRVPWTLKGMQLNGDTVRISVKSDPYMVAKIIITDPQGNIVFTQEEAAFGTDVSLAEFRIDMNTPKGIYTITVTEGEHNAKNTFRIS